MIPVKTRDLRLLDPEPSPIQLAVLSCAYNESGNIAGFLRSVLTAEIRDGVLTEVVVVASGCTDSTPKILEEFRQLDSRVHPVYQEKREGKVSALRLGFSQTRGDVVLVENPDTLPGPGTLQKIIASFSDSTVDIVCCRPVPVIREGNLANRLARVLWSLHDEISRLSPKPGEAYAIRREKFPTDSASYDDDDTMLSIAVRSGSLKAKYCPEAVIFNNSPTTIGEFARQRLRIDVQMANASRRSAVVHGTWSPGLVMRATTSLILREPKNAHIVTFYSVLEVIIRIESVLLGLVRRRRSDVWEPIESTKTPVEPESSNNGFVRR